MGLLAAGSEFRHNEKQGKRNFFGISGCICFQVWARAPGKKRLKRCKTKKANQETVKKSKFTNLQAPRASLMGENRK
jgi:hypothetical protein